MKQTRWTLVLVPVLLLGLAAAPAMAGHKHRRGCGHVYSRAHHGWVSVNVATPHFGFSYSRAPRYDPYGYDDRYQPDRYYDRGYDRGYGDGRWDPYGYDSRYDDHRGYWRDHHGHRHGYQGRCR